MKDSEIRKRLKKVICCLSAVLILSVVSGAVLLNSIGSTNGWGRTEKQEDEIYTKEQIDKFITSVLIIVQNQPLSSDKAGADMVFIASFDSFRQRLTCCLNSWNSAIPTTLRQGSIKNLRWRRAKL